MKPEFDTQANVRPWEPLLSKWEHAPRPGTELVECEEIRPHYNGDNPRWNCSRCYVPVRVRA
jgi:hypothetical protein